MLLLLLTCIVIVVGWHLVTFPDILDERGVDLVHLVFLPWDAPICVCVCVHAYVHVCAHVCVHMFVMCVHMCVHVCVPAGSSAGLARARRPAMVVALGCRLTPATSGSVPVLIVQRSTPHFAFTTLANIARIGKSTFICTKLALMH